MRVVRKGGTVTEGYSRWRRKEDEEGVRWRTEKRAKRTELSERRRRFRFLRLLVPLRLPPRLRHIVLQLPSPRSRRPHSVLGVSHLGPIPNVGRGLHVLLGSVLLDEALGLLLGGSEDVVDHELSGREKLLFREGRVVDEVGVLWGGRRGRRRRRRTRREEESVSRFERRDNVAEEAEERKEEIDSPILLDPKRDERARQLQRR